MRSLLFLSSTLLACCATASPTSSPVSGKEMQARQSPDDMLTFLCNNLPDICTNMCYGAVCRSIGSTLVYDKADAATKRQRRKTAGCIASGGNRCSVKQSAPAGQQCDEFPFASTSDGANDERINRCVPADQNRSQGGTINSFYRGSFCGGGPCTFRINFGNPGNIPYCESIDNCPANGAIDSATQIPILNGDPGAPQDGDDAEDGTDLEDLPPDEEEPEKRKRTPLGGAIPKYKTKLGLEIAVPGGAEIGQRTWWPSPKNETLWDMQIKTDIYDDYEEGDHEELTDNLFWNEDFIVEEIL